jgi:hypothetical protein
MLDRSFALGLEIGAWAASGEDSSRLGLCFNEERERINAGARAFFSSAATGERIELLWIVSHRFEFCHQRRDIREVL